MSMKKIVNAIKAITESNEQVKDFAFVGAVFGLVYVIILIFG